ncbi:MAG: (d)CMP kinase [Chloroflexota bacterium]|nr:(d)CMP kinase [Chloroflexota bacterium]MDE2960729.1 (d)CMP kinase [Chloroflexota bacterium]
MSPSCVAPVVAIDGPVASGKSSVGKAAARIAGLRFLDTGIMYRAVTWLALHRGIAATDAGAVAELAARCRMEPAQDDDNAATILVDGKPLRDELVTADVDSNVSAVSAVSAVRVELVKQQRAIAGAGGMVMAGRDIGSVVLPEADLKLYIDAAPAERARRRHAQIILADPEVPYDQVLADTLRRDRMDMERADSPLVAAADAVVIRTDDMDFDQTVSAVVAAIQSVASSDQAAEPRG